MLQQSSQYARLHLEKYVNLNKILTYEWEKSRYDVTIDIFSLGVVAIFTISQTFPCNLLAPTYRDERRRLVARTELERREPYMQKVYGQLREGHPLIQMIEQCLENFPEERPTIQQVVQLVEQARTEIGHDESDMNKMELVRTLKEVGLFCCVFLILYPSLCHWSRRDNSRQAGGK